MSANAPSEFEQDTAVEKDGEQRYAGTITDRWDVLGGAPNGGYLLAIAARAMANAADRPDPVTLTAHYLRPPQHGPVSVATEIVRAGGRHVTVAAAMEQGGTAILRLLGTFVDLSTAAGTPLVLGDPPMLPPRHECVSRREMDEAFPTPEVVRRFDVRIPRAHTTWALGEPSGEGRIGGWVSWADGSTMDTLGLLVVADAFPPAAFDAGLPLNWVPTVELTVQIRRRPTPGQWLRTEFTTRHVVNGYLEEDGVIWDDEGPLAVSRQLALAPRPA